MILVEGKELNAHPTTLIGWPAVYVKFTPARKKKEKKEREKEGGGGERGGESVS